MTREELAELHFITAIDNVPSIARHGILSHARASRVEHVSVAMPEIQQRRQNKVVPAGRPLHEYANLYVNARNKMMYRVKSQHGHEGVCVLRISPTVLDLPGVVIADENASSDYVRFAKAPDGLKHIDRATVFADSWTHPGDQIAEWRHGSAMCAEVLVPDRVPPEYIVGVYASSEVAGAALSLAAPGLSVNVNARLFFV